MKKFIVLFLIFSVISNVSAQLEFYNNQDNSNLRYESLFQSFQIFFCYVYALFSLNLAVQFILEMFNWLIKGWSLNRLTRITGGFLEVGK